jgi:aquaporin Z
MRDDHHDDDPPEPPPLWRQLTAETIGTFLLTFFAAGGEMMSERAPGDVSDAAKVVAPGLIVLAMIYALSDVSGAHFNPAVTFGFALRRAFPWRRVPVYWAAELTGAILAAIVLRAMLGDIAHVGATRPKLGEGLTFGAEIVLTFALVTIILGTATRAGVIGPNAALAVGATISACGLVFAPIGGASMNPARSFGPALVSGELRTYWPYLAGPAAGAALAAAGTWLTKGAHRPDEKKAAEGAKEGG